MVFGSSDRWAFLTPNPFVDSDIEGNRGASGNSQLYNNIISAATGTPTTNFGSSDGKDLAVIKA